MAGGGQIRVPRHGFYWPRKFERSLASSSPSGRIRKDRVLGAASMELGVVSVLEQKATAISSEDLEATPVAELPPSVGKMI